MIFQNSVYDRNFGGGFGLKAVAPAILSEEANYDGMEVADGVAAQRAFEKIVRMNSQEINRDQLVSDLRNYCKKDTDVMIGLVTWLYKV